MTTFSLTHVPVTATVFGPGGSAATAALKLWPGQLTITLLDCAKTLTLPEAVFVVSATEVAVMVTGNNLGGAVAGAVYVVAAPLSVDVGETLPHAAAEHATVHVTPLLAESLLTVAVNCAVASADSVAAV